MRTFYNTSRTGATRVWSIEVRGDEIRTEFGQLGGKTQVVRDYGTAKNVGRANEVSAEDDALNIAERLIRAKTRKGYSEELPWKTDTAVFDPFYGALPENLRFYKPKNALAGKLRKLAEEGKAWAIRKYDGEMMILLKNLSGEASIYSRRMHPSHHLEDEPWSARFPHIAREVEDNPEIPPGTILLGEIVGADPDTDSRWEVAKVLKSYTTKALELQEQGPLNYVIWDIAWWDGRQLLSEIPVRYRLPLVRHCSGKYLHGPTLFTEGDYKGIQGLQTLASRCGWEGFVILDPDSTYDSKGYNFRGTSDRPKGCAKLKPVFEDDFLAFFNPERNIGSYGRGKNTGKLGSVDLYQYNSRGELIYICGLGNGWTARFIDENSSPDLWPKVLQVKYDSRSYTSNGDRSNALQFPRFLQERSDKTEEECINPEL